MYIAEVVKKLMLLLAGLMFSLGVFADSTPTLSAESLQARLARIVQSHEAMRQEKIRLDAWVEATRPAEGREPSQRHLALQSDLRKVNTEVNSLGRIINFLSEKFSSGLDRAELVKADTLLNQIETTLATLELPQAPEGEIPQRVIDPGPEEIVVTPLDPIPTPVATVAPRVTSTPIATPTPIATATPVPTAVATSAAVPVVTTTVLPPEDSARDMANIYAEISARVERIKKAKREQALQEEAKRQVQPEEPAPVRVSTPEPTPTPEAEERPKQSLSVRGVGYNPDKIQFVTLQCPNALNVMSTTDPATRERIDDIACKKENGEPTKVLILDFKDNHYKVFVNGFAGWISASETSQPQEVGADDERDWRPVSRSLRGQLNCDTRLRHRGGPSTDYRILDNIPCKTNGQPTEVKVYAKHNQTGWYLVEHQGKLAWSSNRYIRTPDDSDLQVVTDEVLQGLGTIPDLGDLGFKCDPEGNQNHEERNCVTFRHDFYSKADSGRQIAASINEAKQRGTNAKKQRFFELFAPIAIYIQTQTGWPASVTLAQMALETAWGTSNVFRSLNNFGGHSCTRREENGSRPVRNSLLARAVADPNLNSPGAYRTSSGSIRIHTPCTYPRPRNEGHYYRTFPSVIDAAILYNDNLMESGYYPDSANHVKQRFSQGRPADAQTVVRGLRRYARDEGYRGSLMSVIRANNLSQYDTMKSCPLGSRR